MQRLVILLTFFLIKTLSAQTLKADFIFENVNIITMKDDNVIKKQTIVIIDEKIVEITPNTIYISDNIIDAQGKYLMPTLADAHVHFPKEDVDFEKVMKLNLINGITKLRSMRGNWEDITRKEKYNTSESYYPKLYISPPVLHRSYELNYQKLEEYVLTAKNYGFDFIKILSIKDEETLRNLNKLSEKHQVAIGGHFPFNPQGPTISDELIFSKNYTSTEHLGGLIGDSDNLETRISYIKNNDVYVCPTLQWYAIGYGQYEIDEMLNQRGMEYIAGSIKSDWTEGTKTYRAKLGEEGFALEKENYAKEMQERFNIVKRLNEEDVKLLLSPDSSSKFIVPGFGLFEEINLYKKAGLSNYDILKAATINYASLYKENYGKIEIGADADFMLLSSNPLDDIKALENIEAIYFNHQYLDKDKLNEIAKTVLPE